MENKSEVTTATTLKQTYFILREKSTGSYVHEDSCGMFSIGAEGPSNHDCEPYRIWDGEKAARFVYFDGRLAKIEDAARELIDEMNQAEELTQDGHFNYADFEVVEVKATYEIGEPTPVE